MMNSYRLFGPTTVHMELEFYQLVAMLFLTLSSLRGLHQDDYWGMMAGDFKYVFSVAIWLGRNILIRWICTSDQSTHKSPSLKGVIAHWLCSIFVGGQYFNRPHPEAVAKQLGTYQNDNGRNEFTTLSDFLLPSILYTWHTIKVRIVFPFLEAKDSFLNRLPKRFRPNISAKQHNHKIDSRKGNDRSASSRLKLSRFYSHYRKRWIHYIPPAQVLPIILFVTLVYNILLPGEVQDDSVHALTMNTRATSNLLSGLDSIPYGGYAKLAKPRWSLILLLMSIIGTSATILLYGRVFLPIGDLTEGGNILKAIRNEFKPNHQQQHSGHHHGSGKSKSKNQKELPEPLPWPENYVSVANENRFRLLSKSVSIRIIENLVVCALFPRTRLICRFTGNCPEGMSMSQLARVLYPAGVVAALRSDGEPQNQLVFVDTERGSVVATILSVILITLSSLLTQGATLNRAYFATLGYLAGGWTIVNQSHPAVRGKSKLPQWDSRKQYKKGDIISQPFPGIGTQTLYMATTDQPEGKPFDLSLRVVHDTFRNEHCHPANSDLIKFLVQMQLNMIVGLVIMMVVYQIVNVDCGSLRWVLLANLTATYGTIKSTRTRGLSEVQKLAQEISGPDESEESDFDESSERSYNDDDHSSAISGS